MDILLDVFLRDYSAYEGSGMDFYIWIGLLVLQLYVSLLICGKYFDFLVRFHPSIERQGTAFLPRCHILRRTKSDSGHQGLPLDADVLYL